MNVIPFVEVNQQIFLLPGTLFRFVLNGVLKALFLFIKVVVSISFSLVLIVYYLDSLRDFQDFSLNLHLFVFFFIAFEIVQLSTQYRCSNFEFVLSFPNRGDC